MPSNALFKWDLEDMLPSVRVVKYMNSRDIEFFGIKYLDNAGKGMLDLENLQSGDEVIGTNIIWFCEIVGKSKVCVFSKDDTTKQVNILNHLIR